MFRGAKALVGWGVVARVLAAAAVDMARSLGVDKKKPSSVAGLLVRQGWSLCRLFVYVANQIAGRFDG